jgi:glyoxylase-like metal-dependent hydrolase (beta-lactamase superfamily II)
LLQHVGDITGFPKSTELVFGPRTNKLDQKALSTILYVDESALEGRKITFLDQSSSDWKPVGAFNGLPARFVALGVLRQKSGIDYWGDGSLFLLDSPGHMEGHLAALVRTADSPSAYHLLAGDIAHHISVRWSTASERRLNVRSYLAKAARQGPPLVCTLRS